MKKEHILYFILALAGLALYAVTYFDRGLMRNLLSYGAYYIILLLSLLWMNAVARSARFHKTDMKALIWSNRFGILISLILTSIVFLSVQSNFRVLSDETNLVAVSKSMVYEHRTDNVTEGKWYYDNFYPTNRSVEKRPYVFPFLASILHTVLGYRPENVFVLNYLALFFLLALGYAVVRSFLGELWAFSSVILIASQPIVVQCATSGGFDLLAGLFLLISFVCLWLYLQEPSKARLHLLWFSLLMHANVRYEGILAFGIVIGCLVLFGHLRRTLLKDGLSVICVTPIIMLPFFWQRMLAFRTTENPSGVPAFSFQHFLDNHTAILKSFVDFRFYLPYATIVDLIGLAGLLYVAWLLLFERGKAKVFKERPSLSSFIAIVGVTLAAYWVVYTSYYFGKIDHPSSSRFFLPFFFFLSLMAVMALSQLKFLRQKSFYAAAFSLVMLFLYQPVSIEDRFSRTQTLPREYRYTMEFLEKTAADNRRFLVFAERPGQYTVYNYGAVTFSRANGNYDRYMTELRNHLYEEIYVIQDINLSDNTARGGTKLDKRYKLETITESQNTSFVTRISKVTLPKPEEKPEENGT